MQTPMKTPPLLPIRRDAAGLAQTRFCHEEPDGGITLTVEHNRYELPPEAIADDRAYAETVFHLACKTWFTLEVGGDFQLIVASIRLSPRQRPA